MTRTLPHRTWGRAVTRVVGLALAVGSCRSGPKTTYAPRDPLLRDQPLLYYPVEAGTRATAFVLFLGNDVGFWKPHQELAFRLSKAGYTVVGIDIKKYLAAFPPTEPERDSAFSASIGPLIARIRREMSVDSLPMIVGGHSFGAEVALWIALHHPPPGLLGVLAMSTRSSGHLRVTPLDLMNREASGKWSFSTIRAAADIAPSVRIAIIRGASDPFAKHDSAFAVAGGARLRVYRVPFANHSLQRLIIAGPIIERAVEFLLDRSAPRMNDVRLPRVGDSAR